jgi:hypothetical protein
MPYVYNIASLGILCHPNRNQYEGMELSACCNPPASHRRMLKNPSYVSMGWQKTVDRSACAIAQLKSFMIVPAGPLVPGRATLCQGHDGVGGPSGRAERIFSPRIDSLVVEPASEAFCETPFGAPPRDIAAVGGSVYRCEGIARMGVSCPWTLAGYSAVW